MGQINLEFQKYEYKKGLVEIPPDLDILASFLTGQLKEKLLIPLKIMVSNQWSHYFTINFVSISPTDYVKPEEYPVVLPTRTLSPEKEKTTLIMVPENDLFESKDYLKRIGEVTLSGLEKFFVGNFKKITPQVWKEFQATIQWDDQF